MVFIGCAPVDCLSACYLDKSLTIDGNLSDWPKARDKIVVTDRKIAQGGIKRILSDNRISCTSAWDTEYLYLAFQVDDTQLNAVQIKRDHTELYLDDMVEFLLDPLCDASDLWLPDDMVYHINLLGTVKDDRGTVAGKKNIAWNGTAKYALKLQGTLNNDTDLDGGYILEVAIPWEELGVTPISGLELGYNFANGDNDGKGRQLFDWRSAWPMRNPRQFGTIELIKE